MIRIEWGGEHLQLHVDRAVFWGRRSTLIIADPHFGKAATMRSAGIPVPPGTTSTNLQRLEALLDATRAERLLILGDFFHAAAGRADATMQTLSDWRARRSALQIILVRGNHDRFAGAPPSEWNFELVGDEWRDGPFLFCHHACGTPAPLVMAGHIHPAVLLEDADGTSVRFPCFLFGAGRALLPAFGRFTGGKRISPSESDRVFVTTDNEVVEVRRMPGRRSD